MAFRGRHFTRSKIVINNKIIEQMNMYNYLGFTLLYEGVEDVTNKLTKFLEIAGIISQVLKPSKSPEINQAVNIQRISHIYCTIWQ
jgi:hypothetical protein